MYSTAVFIVFACFGYYGSIHGGLYEHECPIFQCTGYKMCYNFSSYCDNKTAEVKSCFPNDINSLTWCKKEHHLMNPQCKYACDYIEMELSNKGKSYQNTSCELYTCRLSGKIECYGYQEFCGKREEKVKSCFPEKIEANEEKLKSWCQAGYEPKNDQCKLACIDRFPELASSSAHEFQHDSCPIHACHLSGETMCYGNQQYCDRPDQAVKSCFPEIIKEDRDKLLKWCQEDPVPVNKQCKFACNDNFTRAELHPPTEGDGDKSSLTTGDMALIILAVLVVICAVIPVVVKRKTLLQRCNSLRQPTNNNQNEESDAMVNLETEDNGLQGQDEHLNSQQKDNNHKDEEPGGMSMRNQVPGNNPDDITRETGKKFPGN